MAGYFAYSMLGNHTGKLPVVMDSPDFTLQGLDGNPFTYSANNTGNVHIIEFMFTQCPDICPATTYNLVQIQEELKKEALFGSKVNFLAISFDPANDTPQVLRKYADRLGMDMSGWSILTGKEEDTKKLAEKFGISITKMPDGTFVHTATSLLLIDDKQRVRKVYRMGNDMDNELILNDIRTLINEKGA
ncbi:SCO family protein [Paenibacillus sepulcri]|uniref:SCO family protein n=2 Tax=Paenibacillus sepulcri TaxID=359917 RepID=A0ABS7C624_9BACL|nr:SCO family protein [Paenibacillus sepulcri]